MFSSQLSCCSCSVRALGIIDYEKRCLAHLYREAPDIRWALQSLEDLIQECKFRTDDIGVEYDIWPLLQFLKDLPITLPFETHTINLVTRLKYHYFKKKLSDILKDTPVGHYIQHLKRVLKLALSAAEVEDVVTKFLKVCKTLKLETELTFEETYQYEFMAELLKKCYEMNVQNSALLIALVTMTIDRNMVELSGRGLVQQPAYSHLFMDYILEHSRKERFDLDEYCRRNPETLWDYSRCLSVLSAASFGNVERTRTLLQHGLEVFPEKERRKGGHGFPFAEDIIPDSQLFILRVLSKMRAVNQLLLNAPQGQNNGLYALTKDQKECFIMLWKAVHFPFVKEMEMSRAITAEYFHLAEHGVVNPKRYENNTKFSIMYELMFPEIAEGAKSPRSLKHLCRYSIRQNLKNTWNLPNGIFQLELPKSLKFYLNLEED